MICSVSTVFAVLPSSSIPLRMYRKPARLIDLLEISVIKRSCSDARRSAASFISSAGGDVGPEPPERKLDISMASGSESSTCGGSRSIINGLCPTKPCMTGRATDSAPTDRNGWRRWLFQK